MSRSQKKWAMLLTDLFVHIPLYLLVNTYVAARGISHNLAVPWDYSIPFIKYFAPFYAVVYFVPVVCFLICWDNYELVKGGFKAFLFSGLICLTFFIFYPVEFQLRASLSAPYDVFENLVRFFYWADNPPYNCFPSLHVSGALLSARMIYLYRRSWAPWFYTLAALIVLSTMLIRQHYLVDVAAGFFLHLLLSVIFLPGTLLKTLERGNAVALKAGADGPVSGV
jgi:membrane-associated phospholipid phosphatase